MKLSSLPIDVSDRLLTSLPDFYTLRCAVLSCKCLQEAFETRKASIRHAVALREVGNALKYALLLARIKLNIEREDIETVLDWLNDGHAHGSHFTNGITAKEAGVLVRVSSVVKRLDILYCVRCVIFLVP